MKITAKKLTKLTFKPTGETSIGTYRESEYCQFNPIASIDIFDSEDGEIRAYYNGSEYTDYIVEDLNA